MAQSVCHPSHVKNRKRWQNKSVLLWWLKRKERVVWHSQPKAPLWQAYLENGKDWTDTIARPERPTARARILCSRLRQRRSGQYDLGLKTHDPAMSVYCFILRDKGRQVFIPHSTLWLHTTVFLDSDSTSIHTECSTRFSYPIMTKVHLTVR